MWHLEQCGLNLSGKTRYIFLIIAVILNCVFFFLETNSVFIGYAFVSIIWTLFIYLFIFIIIIIIWTLLGRLFVPFIEVIILAAFRTYLKCPWRILFSSMPGNCLKPFHSNMKCWSWDQLFLAQMTSSPLITRGWVWVSLSSILYGCMSCIYVSKTLNKTF